MRLTSSPGASRSEKSTGKATQKSVDSLWENLTEPLLVKDIIELLFHISAGVVKGKLTHKHMHTYNQKNNSTNWHLGLQTHFIIF